MAWIHEPQFTTITLENWTISDNAVNNMGINALILVSGSYAKEFNLRIIGGIWENNVSRNFPTFAISEAATVYIDGTIIKGNDKLESTAAGIAGFIVSKEIKITNVEFQGNLGLNARSIVMADGQTGA
jgi:hypothetical protein